MKIETTFSTVATNATIQKFEKSDSNLASSPSSLSPYIRTVYVCAYVLGLVCAHALFNIHSFNLSRVYIRTTGVAAGLMEWIPALGFQRSSVAADFPLSPVLGSESNGD